MARKKEVVESDNAEIVQVNINPQEKIIQSNRLVEASFSLSTIEIKMMFAIISQLHPYDDVDFQTSEIDVDELADFCNFHSNDRRNQIRLATKKLMEKVIVMPNGYGKSATYSHWVQQCKYLDKEDGSASVVYRIDRDLVPELLQLRAAYTTTKAQLVMLMKSQYSIRFYELFIQYKKIGHRYFSLEQIRELFDLTKKKAYDIFACIRTRIIEPSINEINQVTDLIVEPPEYRKKGHKVVGVYFMFKEKAKQGEPDKALNEAPPPESVDFEWQKLYKKLIDPQIWGINEFMAKKILNHYDHERVKNNILYAEKYLHGKKNHAGWLISCIEKDEFAQEQKRRQEAEKIAREQRERGEQFKAEMDAKFREEDAKKRREEMERESVAENLPWYRKYDGKAVITAYKYYTLDMTEEEFLHNEQDLLASISEEDETE